MEQKIAVSTAEQLHLESITMSELFVTKTSGSVFG
jgi:hypothetical protein